MPKSSARTPGRRPTAVPTHAASSTRIRDRVHRRRLCCARARTNGLPTSWRLRGSRLREFALHHLRTAPINASMRFLANSFGGVLRGAEFGAPAGAVLGLGVAAAIGGASLGVFGDLGGSRRGGGRGWSAAWSALRSARITATTWGKKSTFRKMRPPSSCWRGVRSLRLAAFGGRSGGLERCAYSIQPCTQCSRRRR
jgi:hypothetical protein